jgi:protein SCO1
MVRTAIAALAAASVFGAALWQGTDGLKAFTTEGARRLSVIEQPRPVPAVRLIDMQGRQLTLADEIGRAVVVEFIYATCPTICVALGESFAKLRDQVLRDGLANQVRLISISFDLHDSYQALEDYAEAHGADGRLWITARPENEQVSTITHIDGASATSFDGSC